MKKILVLLTIIFSTILLSSCWNKSEEQKIADDLDLEIQEFTEQNPESDLNKSWDKKDESQIESTEEKAKETPKKTEEVKIEKTEEKKEIEVVKTVEEFATCITKNWIKLYWTSWCTHCQKQKEMFWEDAVKNLDFTDCDKNKKACKEAWITWYPTWRIWWKLYPWVQNFEKLWELANCKLVK